MDEIAKGIGQSLAHAGPEWGLLLFAIAAGIWAAKNVWLPYMERRQSMAEKEADARIALEAQREDRKSRESADRLERDRELTKMQGQWLEQYDRANRAQEQSNVVTEGVRAEMQLLNATLADSKEHSREMGIRLHEIATEVHDVHEHVTSERKDQ